MVLSQNNSVYEKKNQEESLLRREKEIQSMARASLDPLIMINGQGVINFWNPAAKKLFGYPEIEALGVCIHTLLAGPEDREKALEMMPEFARTGEGSVINNVREIQARCKNGALLDVELSVAAFEVNGQWCAVGVLRDVTERKKNREALQTAWRKAEEANRQLSMELLSLSELQQSLLPDKPYTTSCLSARGFYQPSGLAAGDYFDYLALPGGALRCVIADVSGHGARAAFIMSMVRTFFHFAANQKTPLSDMIEALNRQLIQKVGKQGDFVTLLVTDIYPENGCIEYINAGHCPGFFKDEEKMTEIEATSPLLGVVDTGYPHQRLECRGKWELLLYTDGFYECRIQGRGIFGYDSFKNLCVTLLNREVFDVDQLPGEVANCAEAIVGFDDDLTALHVSGTSRGIRTKHSYTGDN
ncbi:PAS domain S-box-containing protein [Desulfosalsimonas propionicica]|uniref:PAS domain S-box-containing protein n=1 Tax=Desulfosalsimonas propionicica TaxID=332175 RepID=A0A7W0CAL0_9BACT|nr:SpoIIE family protein phosphatase [Desulfosalsimonas propionicica]MBA2882225.1 PAS domain S-box-containing protein [Desulfosalsimonas propionicica]